MDDEMREALNNIESQLDNGYLDIAEDYDETEMEIIRTAIEEYKSNHL